MSKTNETSRLHYRPRHQNHRHYHLQHDHHNNNDQVHQNGHHTLSKENHHQPKPSNHATFRSEEVEFMFREPFILTGYRPSNQPWRYYLASAFWIHNETVNVWTHVIGCALVVARVLALGTELDDFGDPRAGPVIGFGLGCVLSNVLSFTAHMLHSKSPRHHYVLYIMDYAGITLYNLGNGVGSMYSCSHPRNFRQMEGYFLPAVVVLSWASFLVCVRARLKYKGQYEVQRKLIMMGVFGSLGAFLAWPMVGRYWDCLQDPRCSLSSLNHISVVFLLYVVNALCYTSHCPERWWPGRFDVWGQGHQWFHVSVTVTQQFQLHALQVDLVQLDRAHHALVPLATLLAAFAVLMLAEMLTLRLLSPAIDAKVSQDMRCGSELKTDDWGRISSAGCGH